MGHCLYIQPVIKPRSDGAISDCKSWNIGGNWLHNVLKEKKRLPKCGAVKVRKGSCSVSTIPHLVVLRRLK